MLEIYAITGILGSKRLETELVKFHCPEFEKAKPQSCHAFVSLSKQQHAGNLLSFNVFAGGVQSSIIKNNAMFKTKA